MSKWIQALVALTCAVVLSVVAFWAYERFNVGEMFEERILTDEEARGPHAYCLMMTRVWDTKGPEFIAKTVDGITEELIEKCRAEIAGAAKE